MFFLPGSKTCFHIVNFATRYRSVTDVPHIQKRLYCSHLLLSLWLYRLLNRYILASTARCCGAPSLSTQVCLIHSHRSSHCSAVWDWRLALSGSRYLWSFATLPVVEDYVPLFIVAQISKYAQEADLAARGWRTSCVYKGGECCPNAFLKLDVPNNLELSLLSLYKPDRAPLIESVWYRPSGCGMLLYW